VTVLGRVGRAPALALWVDPKVHAAEVARFRSKIVAGPGERDCSIWIGSIGADGYSLPCIRQHFPIDAGCETRRKVLILRTATRRGEVVGGPVICFPESAADGAGANPA
jgi:hypothetical protein